MMAGERAGATPAAGSMSSEGTPGNVIRRCHGHSLSHGDSVVIIIVVIVRTGKDGGAERSKKEDRACELHFEDNVERFEKLGSWLDGS